MWLKCSKYCVFVNFCVFPAKSDFSSILDQFWLPFGSNFGSFGSPLAPHGPPRSVLRGSFWHPFFNAVFQWISGPPRDVQRGRGGIAATPLGVAEKHHF